MGMPLNYFEFLTKGVECQANPLRTALTGYCVATCSAPHNGVQCTSAPHICAMHQLGPQTAHKASTPSGKIIPIIGIIKLGGSNLLVASYSAMETACIVIDR